MTEPASTANSPSDPFASGADALRPANGSTPMNGSANGTKNGEKVIDLRDAGTTRVRVSRENNAFSSLTKQQRMRLIVRVLCEIVAYGELDDDPKVANETPVPEQPAVNS